VDQRANRTRESLVSRHTQIGGLTVNVRKYFSGVHGGGLKVQSEEWGLKTPVDTKRKKSQKFEYRGKIFWQSLAQNPLRRCRGNPKKMEP